MASPIIGANGKNLQDRILAAKVRNKALEDIHAVLEGKKTADKFSDYKKQMLLRLATTLLPRLNEHTGADGEPLKLSFDASFNAVASSSTGNS